MNIRISASLLCVVLAAVVVGIANGGPDAEEEVRGFDDDMMEMVATYGPILRVAQGESPRLRRDLAELELKWGQQHLINYIDGIADTCSDEEFAFVSMLAVSNNRAIGRAVINMAERCTDSHFGAVVSVLVRNRLEITPAICRRALQSDDSDMVWDMLIYLDYVRHYEVEDIPLLQVAIADAAEASDVIWRMTLCSLILHRNALVRWAGHEQAYALIVRAIDSNRQIQQDHDNKAYHSLKYLEYLYGIGHSYEVDVTRSRVQVIQSLINHRAEVIQAEAD